MTRFTFVDRENALYAVAVLCRLLKVSRAGYYAWVSRPPSAREVGDGVLTTQIHGAFDSNRKVCGSPRIHAELADADVHVGRKRVAPVDAGGRDRGLSPPQAQAGITKQNPNAAAAHGPGGPRQFAATAPAIGQISPAAFEKRYAESPAA